MTKKNEISRRHAQKKRTTKVLRDAAIELFLAQGYDMTTADQIAAKAGVSARTFFRYFDTKDEVMFKGQRPWADAVMDRLMQQPKSLSPIRAMANTLAHLASLLNSESLVRFGKIVESSATLRGCSAKHNAENTRHLALALAAWRGLETPDDECDLIAAICLQVMRCAVDDLRHGKTDLPIDRLVLQKFDILLEAMQQ